MRNNDTKTQSSEFAYFRDNNHEIGFVEQILKSVVYASGIPGAHLFEKVIFESGDVGHVISLTPSYAEILMLTPADIRVGDQVSRTNQTLDIAVSRDYLGCLIDPLGTMLQGKQIDSKERRAIDVTPPGLSARSKIVEPLETGTPLIDLVVPLARGQRELVIGDRKTGKSSFLLQTASYCVKNGYICIYAAIGKRNSEIVDILSSFTQNKTLDKSVIVASTASDPAGLNFITPYTAMTIAEYFRDLGQHVVLILDDLTTHAQIYREIMLLARKFPGRNSYPGDIFYTHARLLERAGSFKKGSISCLPVAESILGDLSGYIQTNLMAITDGHLFFDINIFNEGRRPAINPYLSVTRVGEQTQKAIVRDASLEINRFLVYYQRLKQLKHFGSEVGENVKQYLNRGERLTALFDQAPNSVIPLNLSVYLVSLIWIDYYNEVPLNLVRENIERLKKQYETDEVYRNNIDAMISSASKFSELLKLIIDRKFLPEKYDH